MTFYKQTIWLILLFLPLFNTEAADPKITVTLGQHRVVFPAGYRGLNYFPDEPISVIKKNPFQYLMTAGDSTYLMQGRTLDNAVPIKKVLVPGAKTEFDNGYAGITSTVYNNKRKQLLAFYHAEDHVGMPKVSYNKDIQGAYWSIGMAVLNADSNVFTKSGQILTPSVRKSDVTHDHQGIGDVCVITDSTNTYLYAYFTDLTRKQGSKPAKIGMARSRIVDGGKPGSWYKFHNGGFTEKGRGGMESPVVFPPASFPCDVYAPHVTYIRELKKYMMVCNVMVYSDHEKQRAEKGGIYFCFSDDGINWSEPKSLVTGHPVPYQGRKYVGHPHLLITRATVNRVSGWLLYAYTPRWGTKAPNQPHHLAKRTITINLGKDSDTTSTQPTPRTTPVDLTSLRKLANSEKVNTKGEIFDLDLTGASLTESHLAAIGTLRSLGSLALRQTNVTNENLEIIGKLTKLKYLSLGKTRITSDGLRHLKGLKNLKGLRINGNKGIGDSGVEHLTGMKKLTVLQINNTSITGAGVQKLKRALPNCKIIR
ncbi:hypothetical protein [Gimesia algae]|uniref:Leucine Rich repeats (2 copies) n=1 Tax=Gimesia algae TaxID=2527971 RepID=A0A517VFN5_9PLAN|nr:hypothetical protein [Gimesia algae]QDT91767.1 Leucine Rich repeats (2 copies) [Gimesia algae]